MINSGFKNLKNKLPKVYYILFLKNAIAFNGGILNLFKYIHAHSIDINLGNVFIWEHTREGDEFWRALSKNLLLSTPITVNKNLIRDSERLKKYAGRVE